jgi:hypothetical protein
MKKTSRNSSPAFATAPKIPRPDVSAFDILKVVALVCLFALVGAFNRKEKP